MVRAAVREKDRRSNDVKSSIHAPEKKEGGGGKFTLGKAGDYSGGATVDVHDPNYDPDEKRIDPDDGTAYKYEELAAFYKGKFTAQEIAEYWEYECTALKRRGRAKAATPAGPSLEESALLAKAKSKVKSKAPAKKLTQEDLAGTGEGPLAQEIAEVIPYFPFHKLDKFYDVQGLLNHPNLLNAVCAVMATRFRKLGVTKILAYEARGFLFSPVAIKSGMPFVMLRKTGSMPNTISKNGLCLQQGAIVEGDKVAIVDDLILTGTCLSTGIELVKQCNAEVVECTGVVELKGLGGREKCLTAGAKDVWSLVPEDLLTTKAELPAGYVDDGNAL